VKSDVDKQKPGGLVEPAQTEAQLGLPVFSLPTAPIIESPLHRGISNLNVCLAPWLS
jgi:hypothetical protein